MSRLILVRRMPFCCSSVHRFARAHRASFACLILSISLGSHLSAESVVKRRVLLLDFQNSSKNANYDYLKESLSDNLKVELMKTDKFTVVDQKTFEQLNPNVSTKNLSAAEAGKLAESINCEAVVIGKFLATPKQIRINAQAIDSLTGELVVAEKADGEITSRIFATIDKVVIPLVAGMAQKLPPIGEGKLKRDKEIEAKLARSEEDKDRSNASGKDNNPRQSRTALFAHITGGYFLPLGSNGNYLNNGFSGQGSLAVPLAKYLVPYVSSGALFYSSKTTINSGFFYFADGGLSLPFNLTSKFTLMPYLAAGVLGGVLRTSSNSASLLAPTFDAGIHATYFFLQKLGLTLSASTLYVLDKPNALVFTVVSAGVGLRF